MISDFDILLLILYLILFDLEIRYSLDEVEDVAKKLIKSVNSKTLLLYGNMGVGKTTLIKAMAKVLGSHDEVSSPTFSIVNEYELDQSSIYHFDLYRINDIEEAYNFGIEEYLYSKNWSIIELPDIVKDILPDHFNRIDLVLNDDNSRTLKLSINQKNKSNLLEKHD
ncbi:tRNA (adenosine(37)-N6)-threonylcarbamoyltransferase complex ATPase subunit type 1 TsaE [Thalassobellus suaedae]|uniref:tRNA threonylcarbamoyladenosine biosynthesis protein TsaE n=1 Tax=Thalassobellus suaedae TaxID=3074124 RepID=A0ABY9XWG9_9FLAO|nr:tRNA (adenosine(37)-N6)-threonylcarbamoyltransferase complex ATPase subunit type 1 TsaE [Flavobacteriaceae bacterium HL-DH14]